MARRKGYRPSPSFLESENPRPKPPLGIEPRHIWRQKRAFSLIEAISRYSTAGLAVDRKWLQELGGLLVEDGVIEKETVLKQNNCKWCGTDIGVNLWGFCSTACLMDKNNSVTKL